MAAKIFFPRDGATILHGELEVTTLDASNGNQVAAGYSRTNLRRHANVICRSQRRQRLEARPDTRRRSWPGAALAGASAFPAGWRDGSIPAFARESAQVRSGRVRRAGPGAGEVR